MDVLLKIDDKTLTLISMFMEIGVLTAEEFGAIDHEAFGTSEELRQEALKIIDDLDDAVKYEYIIQSMGADRQWKFDV